MHALRSRATAGAWSALVIAALVVVAGPAAGDDEPDCEIINPTTGQCDIVVQPPTDPTPNPGDPGPGPGNTGDSRPACYWDPAPQGLSGPPAGPVPCTSENGYWSNAYHCYIQALNPQPPATDPAWNGHKPGDGAVYSCYQPQTGILINIWSANPPPGPNTGRTPEEVAQIAIESMQLKAVKVGIVPEPGLDSIGIVGMPTWMWVDNPAENTFGPITRSASAGGITVIATAEVERIEWVMGDGTTVTCSGANAKGTPYADRFGKQDSPTCGHRYETTSWTQPGRTFTVTARSYWRIDWDGAGQSGTIRLDPLEQTVSVRVAEAQVLTH